MHPYIEREAAFGRAMMADLTARPASEATEMPADGKVGVGRSTVHAGGRDGAQRASLRDLTRAEHDAIWDAAARVVGTSLE